MVSISTSQFSFVQFNPDPSSDCADNANVCLPVSVVGDYQTVPLNDIDFSFFISADGADLTQLTLGLTHPQTVGSAEIVFFLLGIDEPCDRDSILESIFSFTDWSSRLFPTTSMACASDDYQFFGYPTAVHAPVAFAALEVDQCFKIIAVKKEYLDGGNLNIVILGCTNCFVRISDDCFTTQLKFTNNSNAFDFNFGCLNAINAGPHYEVVRLPMYLHSPINAEDQTSYFKSDGSSVKLSHRVWKDYKMKTDYWPEDWLEKLTVVTSLDTVLVTNSYSSLSQIAFIRTEKIEIDWQEENMPFLAKAQGKGTLRMAIPRANVNSNCE